MGKKQNNKVKAKTTDSRWIDLFPLILLVAIHPLVAMKKQVKIYLCDYAWFSGSEYQYDFFMYAKMMVFLVLTVCAALLLLDRVIIRRQKISMRKVWILLVLYVVLSASSTIVSISHDLSLKGMWEQYETVWTLIGYVIIAFVSAQIVQTKQQQKILLFAICTGAGAESIIGITQMAGLDVWSGTVKAHQIFLSLYNPNYVGVYIILVLPFAVAGICMVKKQWQKSLFLALTVLLLICLSGSGSRTGVAVMMVLGVILAVTTFPGRKKAGMVGLSILLAVTAWIASGDTGRSNLMNGLKRTITKVEEYKFQDIHADGQQVYFRYCNEEIWLDIVEENGESILIATNKEGMLLPTIWLENQQCWKITEKPFRKCEFAITEQDGIYILCMRKSGADWNFAKKGIDGTYGYVTRFGKINTIEEAPAVLRGYERAFSGRGYIWGRTIPLLPKHLLLGSGPDTFILEFPQNDYVKRYNTSSSMYQEIPSKAHNMYLQTAVQTGVLSLICLLLFWGFYLKESICIYWVQKKKDYIGMACCFSVAGYLMMGVMNDSNLATAPLFWTILGLGWAVNHCETV